MSTKMKFEFEWRDTPLHRMHPVSKLALIASLGGVIGVWMDFRYSLVALAVILVLWFMGKTPRKWVYIPLFFALGTQWSSFFVSLPFIGISYKVLPLDYARTVILDLGYIPTIGRAVYTYGSIWLFVNNTIKYFTVGLLALILYYSTSIPDLVQVLLKTRIPTIITFSIIATFRFFPVMTRLSSDVVNSQALRGWELKSRNPVKFVRMLYPLMTPICRQFLKSVDMVTLSVVNRAFGAYPKRPHKELKMSTMDKVITVVTPILFLLAYYLAITPPYYGNL